MLCGWGAVDKTGKEERFSKIYIFYFFFLGRNSCDALSLFFLISKKKMKADTRYVISQHDRLVSETAGPWMEDLISGRSLM